MTDKSSIRVLVLDDEPFILKLLSHLLARLGYEQISCYESGTAALAALDSAAGDAPDVVLLDINMPDMDGVEFVRHLAERQYRGSLILVSGEDERLLRATEKLVQAHRLTILGALRKPPAPDRLAALLNTWTLPAPCAAPAAGATPARYPAQEVRKAILAGELVNHYQPKIAVATGEVVGVETLVRWRHPTDGLIFPNRFVPVAEESGLIGDMTRQVLKNALAQAKAWQDGGLALHVGINVSMDDLADVGFADFILEEATAVGVPPSSLVLEITESRLMQSLAVALDVLTRLRLKRFRISIDDFGTGHASLAQLRDLPFDELKIDQGFTHNAWQDARLKALFESSVTLAEHLGMDVVAEGVEDQADWDFLQASGSQMAQGYFIARPMPAEALAGWIDRRRCERRAQ